MLIVGKWPVFSRFIIVPYRSITLICFGVTLFVALFLGLFLCSTRAVAEEQSGESVDQIMQPQISILYTSGSSRKHRDDDGLSGDYYFIKRPALGLKLSYEFKNEKRTNSGTEVKDSHHRFKERVGLKTSGWMYHPALMRYTLLFEPEWIQAREEMNPGESSRVDSFSPDYFLTATFLERKPYTLNVFGRRQEIPVWAAFAGNTESVVDSYGANILLRYKILPTNVGYSHIETEQSGFYNSQSIRDNLTLTSRHQTPSSDTSLTSNYTDDERVSEDSVTKIKALNTILLNSYRITKNNDVKLHSTLTHRVQEATNLDVENLRFREHLNWQHRENLQSNQIFVHNRLDSGGFESDLTSLESRWTHLLYENLTTNAGGSIEQYNYQEGRENAGDVFLDLSYVRAFSWGTLNLSNSWDYLYTNRSGSAETGAQVTGEKHSLTAGEEVFLANEDVDLDSIVVTNTLGTTIYIENIDYTVSEISGLVRLTRLPFGEIKEGQIVGVNYSYQGDGGYDDTLLTQSYGIFLDLRQNWRFSYNFLRTTQDIVSGEPPKELVDDTIQRANVRYNIGWSDTSVTYEDSDRQSDLAFTRWKIEETLRFRPLWSFYFTLKGYAGRTDYEERDEKREFYGGVSTIDWILNRRCKLRFEGYYDNTTGDVEDTTNNGIRVGLELRYRIWKMKLFYEMTDQDNKMTEFRRQEQLIRFELIRIMW